MVAVLISAVGIAGAFTLDLSSPLRIAVMVLAMAIGGGLGGWLTRSKRIRAAKQRAKEEAERRAIAEQEYQRKLNEAKERGDV